MKTFEINERQRLLVRWVGNRVVMSVQMAGTVAQVDTQEIYPSNEQAQARFESIGDDDVKAILAGLAFCSDFTKQLITGLNEAEKHANTKEAAKPNHRPYGSNAYGRYRV